MTLQKINLIGVSGRIGSGKDATALMIQALTMRPETGTRWMKDPVGYAKAYEGRPNLKGGWQIRKFADTLKEWTCQATGISREDLEKMEVKDSFLPDEWGYTREERVIDGGEVTIKRVRYNMTVRQFMKKLGTEVARVIHSDFWVNIAFRTYCAQAGVRRDSRLMSDIDVGVSTWVFSDVRFVNEAMVIKDRGGILIRIERGKKPEGKLHISETALDEFPFFDHVIHNDGTMEELLEKVKEILSKYEPHEANYG